MEFGPTALKTCKPKNCSTSAPHYLYLAKCSEKLIKEKNTKERGKEKENKK
jgi:hypothetical protein